MRTVAAAWSKFRTDAIPADIDASELRRIKISFYAGANAMLGYVHECGEKHISDKAGAAILDGLLMECIAFAATKGQS